MTKRMKPKGSESFKNFTKLYNKFDDFFSRKNSLPKLYQILPRINGRLHSMETNEESSLQNAQGPADSTWELYKLKSE